MIIRSIRFYMRARRLSKPLALLMCVALLCACAPTDPQSTAEPAPTSAAPTSAAAATPTPLAGGVLYVPMPEKVTTTNPLLANTREMASLLGIVFDTLLELDTAGAPAPCLAESWAFAQDGTTLTLTLRGNALWHNGRPVDAQDVLFTLDMIRELGDRSLYAYVLDAIETWNGAGNTLTLKLRTPSYAVLHALGFPVLPRDGGYSAAGSPGLPVGSGAFRVQSYEAGKSMRLVRNDAWWRRSPIIEEVVALPFSDGASALSSLLLRQLDVLQSQDITVAQYRDSGSANVYDYTTSLFEYVVLNMNAPDLQDVRMRQALMLALDRTEMASYIYVRHAVVCDTPVAPDSWLYDGQMLRYSRDLVQARELIARQGWLDSDGDGMWDVSPDGVSRKLSFKLLVNSNEDNSLRYDAALLLADQLQDVGITIEISDQPWEQYATALGDRAYDLAMCGINLSPVPDYRFMLASDGAMNYGQWRSTQADALMQTMATTLDRNKFAQAAADLQELVATQLPIIGLYYRTQSLVTTTGLRGVGGVRQNNAYAQINSWYFVQD